MMSYPILILIAQLLIQSNGRTINWEPDWYTLTKSYPKVILRDIDLEILRIIDVYQLPY